jgi:hypothetical protein
MMLPTPPPLSLLWVISLILLLYTPYCTEEVAQVEETSNETPLYIVWRLPGTRMKSTIAPLAGSDAQDS